MFSEEKMLQVIGYLLLLNGKRMNLLKLMKELYLIDRESIEERETSISGDVHFSLRHGPILSMTLNLLNDINKNPKWHTYLHSEDVGYYYPDIVMDKETLEDRLSQKDKQYIKNISHRFKKYTPEQIEDYTHDNLPEWENPGKSSIKITFESIMEAIGKTHEDIKEAKDEYSFVEEMFDVLGVKI